MAFIAACSPGSDPSLTALQQELEATKAAAAVERESAERRVAELTEELRRVNAENVDLHERLDRSRDAVLAARAIVQSRDTAITPGPGDGPVDEAAEPIPDAMRTGVPGLVLLNAQGRSQERNASWWRWAWTVTLANHNEYPVAFKMTVQFVDRDGFVVDKDEVYGRTIEAARTETISDDTLVTASVAPRVTAVRVVITQ